MCTIGIARKLDLIFKNRDKDSFTAEEIVATKDFVAVRTQGDQYYSLGVNKDGCGFVSTAINTPAWTRLAEAGEREKAKVLLARETQGLVCPTFIISQMLLHVKTIDEWISALEKNQSNFRGYNILMADLKSAQVVEVYQQQRIVRDLFEKDAITNHFQDIKFGPRSFEDYPSSFTRKHYAQESMKEAESLIDIESMLKPKDQKRQEMIWRRGNFFTVSTSILDLSHKCLLYARQIQDEYQEIRLVT